MRFYLIILLTIFCGLTALEAQPRRNKVLRKATTSADEIVSLSKTTSFAEAVRIVNDFSKKYLNKLIIDPEGRNFPIGIDIKSQHWLSALEAVLQQNGLWYEEHADHLQIQAIGADKLTMTKTEIATLETFESREVVISAVFFEGDAAKLRQAGMSWNAVRGKDVNLDISNLSADNTGGLLEIDLAPDLEWGSISATFKALESDKYGEVIASPQVAVKSGEEGRIQVGSDISVTLQDFAGNAVTQFFSTGSIIKVHPIISRQDSIDFVKLKLQIERSSSAAGDLGLEIKKSQAETTVMLLDGEETLIGGLYVNEESETRDGVPVLKDLPWWFFGLRYVFGFESKNVIKKELLILLKAELLPTLEERFRDRVKSKQRHLLKEQRRKENLQMDYYQQQLKDKQEETKQ